MSGATAVAAKKTNLAPWLLAAAIAVALLGPLLKAWGMATDLGHGWAAPLLIAYLYWERWDERPSVIVRENVTPAWWVIGGVLLLALAPVRLFVTPFPLWPALVLVYVVLIALVGLSAAYLVAGGKGVRWIGGPLLILAGTLPWPHQIDTGVVQPLRVGLATLAAELINLTGQPALASGTTVRFAAGWVGVDEACGGIRSLQASVMMALFFGEWLRLAWARRMALVGVGILAALLGNFVRILFLAWRATASEAAVESAHDLAGWMALALSLTLTGFFAWWWSRKNAPVASAAGARVAKAAMARPDISAALAKWSVVIAASVLLIETGNYAWYSRGETVRSEVPQWTVRFPTTDRSYKDAPLADASREILRPDFYAAGSWQAGDRRSASAFLVEWHHGQVARFVPVQHNPANCLPYAGCELIEPLEVIQVNWQGGVIPFQTLLFRRANEKFIVAYTIWDPLQGAPLGRPEVTNTRWRWLASQWQEVVHARKDQPGQLFTLALVGAGQPSELKDLIETLVIPRPE